MNNIIFNLQKIDDVLTMSSLEMVKLINSTREEGDAELLHKNFIAKVPQVLGEEMSAKFLAYIETPMPNGGFRESKVYRFPKREACLMAMSYSYELQAAIFDRWQELEQAQQFQLPQNYEEALEHLLVKVKENKVLVDKIEKDAPKVKFHDAIESANNSIPIGVFAKIVKIDELGQNKLFTWFRDNKYLIDGGRRHNTPKQAYVNQGLFEVKESYFERSEGNKVVAYTTLITGKGQVYFEKKLREEFGREYS